MEQDTNLMPHHREVDSTALMHPDDEQVLKDQGGIEILGGQTEAEMRNISFDESQHGFGQSHRISTPEGQTSPAQVKELVIMTDVHQDPTALADATKVYAKATSSSVRFLIDENEQMAKELQVAKQGGDLVTMSTRAELKKEILDDILSLDTFM